MDKSQVRHTFETKEDLGTASCPKCGTKFNHIRTNVHPIEYEVVGYIRNQTDDVRDRTKVTVRIRYGSGAADQVPTEITENLPSFYPTSAEDFINHFAELVDVYQSGGWIFGLGSDKQGRVSPMDPKEKIAEIVQGRLDYMGRFQYVPRWRVKTKHDKEDPQP